MDLGAFADDVGSDGPVTVTGAGTRGGPVPGVRTVRAPAGIDWLRTEEMTVCCGAGTSAAELDDALSSTGQCVALPPGGTVGGALSVGRSGIRRLGQGPVRDVLLQARYVSAAGVVVKAGGPTVKNVSGFDLCRLLVGSRGTLGFLGEVILRTRPRPRYERWFTSVADPVDLLSVLYRPASVLWNGTTTWVLLEGDERDVEAAASAHRLEPASGPPELPCGGRWSVPPSSIRTLHGTFVVEVGVGVVHHADPPPPASVSDEVRELHRRLKHGFDPSGRLNPGVDVLDAG
jgi:glycolate oxidase FAD binding subunit